MHESVSIVIPNWNGRDLLLACLHSLEKQVYRDHRVYVVDNGSSDGSVAAVTAEFPEVVLISLPENLGFARAMNIGFARCAGAYLVALNNDTTVDVNWLKALMSVMERCPEIDFAVSMILCHDDPAIIDCIGDGFGWAGLSFKIADRAPYSDQFDEPFEVLSACAAAAIYRRQVIEATGGFDESFFAYMEDVDLSLRARLAGFRCFAIPAAVVHHVGSASTGGDTSAFSIRMTAKNLIFVLGKTIPSPLVFLMLPLVVAAQILLLFLCLTTSRFPGLRRNLGAYASGLRAGFHGLPEMLRKRAAVQTQRKITVAAFARMIRLSEAQKRTSMPQAIRWR
ncbi:glycosyltransferase family 2 protein [Lichenifustis flavocetrariae]|uniref:Glycosyltransferase family 2 protein n=1 Tax=Lichenifustis flavocetrariae TaxID=2949735 RepID=A0AA41Z1N3_9HYPH|nr:glycosyltransferase family 2 protein [Lichenifustis flavocetrariae]MCW6511347.1 glycosyltransferase family 2 protein [Lichenifustis flavocetrariae]